MYIFFKFLSVSRYVSPAKFTHNECAHTVKRCSAQFFERHVSVLTRAANISQLIAYFIHINLHYICRLSACRSKHVNA